MLLNFLYAPINLSNPTVLVLTILPSFIIAFWVRIAELLRQCVVPCLSIHIL